MSFEELRLRHYELAASGRQQQAIQEAQVLLNEAEQQNATALKDIDGAIKYILDGENRHPNRHDVCKARGADPSKLHGLSGSTTSFSQPSPFVSQPQALSAFGRAPTSAFSQPPPLGQPNPSFGQPTSLGQPSAFARPTSQPNATFGQPSNPGSAFGRSPFAAAPSTAVTNQPINPFQSAHSQPFSQPPSSAPRNPFAQPATQAAPNPFGQPVPQAQNVFSRDSAPQPPPQSTNSFGPPLNSSPYTLAQHTSPQPTSVFGNPSANLSAFSQQSKPASSSRPSNSASPSAFAKPSAPTVPMATPFPTKSQTPSNARRDANGKLLSWKGQAVNYMAEIPCYKNPNGSWERIWFPDGPPAFLKPESLPDVEYDEGTIQNYLQLRQTGRFIDNIIPALPPKREWLSWDF